MGYLFGNQSLSPHRDRGPEGHPGGHVGQSLHRCCICHEPDVQIHHVEGREGADPHNPDNLAPLCPNCHSKVTIKSGFGKQYSPGEVRRFRDQWFRKVEEFHDKAVKSATFQAGTDIPRASVYGLGVPAGVPPSQTGLYLALDEAFNVLDLPIEDGKSGNDATLRARELTRWLLGKLQVGEHPRAEEKVPVAEAIAAAAEMKAFTKIREMNHVLKSAVDLLRK